MSIRLEIDNNVLKWHHGLNQVVEMPHKWTDPVKGPQNNIGQQQPFKMIFTRKILIAK